MNMYNKTHQATDSVFVQNQFDGLRQRATWGRIWSMAGGRNEGLLNLYEVEKDMAVKNRHEAGVQTVPIEKICGSEGRCCDFDAQFRPLKSHTRHRWSSIAMARQADVALPAVDLIQVGDRYFVRDGHHRISVARAFGQLEIDAKVTVWDCSNSPFPHASMRQPAMWPAALFVRQWLRQVSFLVGTWLVVMGRRKQATETTETALSGNMK